MRAAEACALRRDDPGLRQKRLRLEKLAAAFPKLDARHTDPFEAAIISAGIAYFYARDGAALDKFRYASMLKPEDDRPLPFMRELVRVPKSASDPCALEPSPPEETIRACEEVLRNDPKNVRAFLRIAIARCRQRRWGEAESAFRAALAYESEPDVRKAIDLDITAVRRESSLRTAATAAPTLRARAAPRSTQAQLEKWYEQGIAAYAKGDLDGAAALFRKILDADPRNEPARKALDRIEAEKESEP
jgi:tetratricopeptide (TPR) repeat protein